MINPNFIINHSSIFKTIQDDVTGANKSISIFGTTLKDIQNRGLKGLFTTGLSNEDISSLEKYNADIKLGLSPQTAYYNNLQNCSDAAVKLAESAGESEVSLESMRKATTNMSLSAKAGSVALKGLAIAGNMLVGWGISVAITAVAGVIDDLVHSEENLQNSAKELSSTLKNNESDINSYKTKIEELYKTINDSSSSISDVTTARTNLMTVQDELIDKFGDEKGAIETITTAINGQSDALDNLSKKSYLSAKNKFNEKTTGDKFSDWLSFGSTDDDRIMSNMNKMVAKMRHSAYELETTGNDVLDNLIAKSYGLNIFDDMYGDGTHFTITGDLDEIQDKLYGIQEMSSNFDVSTGFENSITTISNDVDTALESYKDLYDQYVLYEKVLNSSKDNQYDEQFDAINKAKEAYDKAFSSGDDTKIQKASENYANILSGAMSMAMNNSDEDVADYFNNMYPELQEIVAGWEFNADFKVNTDDIKTQVSDAVGEFESSEDVLNFNPKVATQEQIDAYGTLTNVAEQYGMTIEQLIALLEKQKLISSESYKELSDKFGKDNVSKLSDEDLQIAYEVSDGTIKSWDELIAKIQEYKDNLENGNETSLSFADAISQVQALSAGLDQLDKIYADVYNKEDFDWSSILNNESFKTTFGDMGSVYDDFIQTVSSTPDDLSACQDSFNKLTTAYINNGTALNSVTESTKAATIAMLEQQGVSNATAMVEARLEANKYALAKGCGDLSDATYQEIGALLQDADASSTATQYIAQLALAKVDLNNTQLKTEDDVNAIISIANAAGASFGQLAALKDAMASLTSFSTKIHGVSFTGDMNDINTTQNALDSLKNTWSDIQSGSYKLNPADYYAKYTGGSGTQSAIDKANKDSSDSTKQAFSEIIDWIDTQISNAQSKAEKAIDAIDKKLTLTGAKGAIKKALKEVNKELDTVRAGKSRYEQEANAVALDESYKEKVRNGTLDIQTITDENLKNQIDSYEQWYDKIVDCDEKIADIIETQKELNAQKLSKITDFYDISTNRYSSATDLANANIDYKKSKGKEVKTSDYKSVIYNANKEESSAKSEYKAYNKEVNNQIKHGILKGSDKTEALAQVNNLKKAWIEAQQAVLDYKDEQKQIKLDNLDAALDRLSAKGDTTQNKIDLKVASGGTESKKDYQNLISNSKSQVKNLESQNKELIKQQKGLSKNSEKYRELQSQIESNTSAIYDAKIQQVEWNATIRDMPNDKLNKALETLQKIHSVYDSLLGLREAQGRKKTDSEILKEISNNNSEIKNLETQKKNAEDNLRKVRDEESKAKSKVSNYQDGVDHYNNHKNDATSEYKSQLKRINSQISLAQKKLAIARKAGNKRQVSKLTEQIKELQAHKTILTDRYNSEIADLNKRLATAKQKLSDARANSDKSADIKKYEDEIADAEKGILDLKTENEGLLDEMIQNRIDAYQDELDKLNKQNEARQKALDIEEAQYELEKSKNQKDKKVFNGSQFVYKSDASTIRTNQEALDKLNFTDLTDSIQDLIDELESMKGEYNLYDEDGNTLNAKTIISSMQSAANSLAKSIAEALKSAGLDVTIPTFSKGGNINGTISPLARKLGEDVIVSAKIGERILTPEQNANWEQWTKALPDLMTYMSPLKNFTPPNYSNLVTKNVTTNMPIESHVTFNCPNVTDKAVCDYVMNELENEFNKLGAQAQQRYSKVGR